MSYRKSQYPYFSLRISKELLAKVSYLASIHGRSANKEIEHIISLAIAVQNTNAYPEDEDDILPDISEDITRTALRISPELLTSLKYIAKCNGRSANKEIEQLLLRYIYKWEQKHNVISVTLQ